MDHRTFLASLSPDTVAALTRRSDAAGLRHLAGHVGGIALCTVWIAQGWPLWWALLPLQGVALAFLFTLEHEATHKTPFATEALNEWAGRMAGLVLLLPFEWFRYFHLAHHRHTNIDGRDPELADYDGRLDRWGPFLLHVSGWPYWSGMARVLWQNAMGRPQGDYLPDRAKPRLTREARWMLGIYTAALASLVVTPLVFWVWLLPVALGQPVLRLYLMAEHGRCPKVADMLDNTRTTHTSRLVRFLAWNMPYHTEHHVLPQVPFHQLPALHARLQPHLKHQTDGYVRFTADTIARF